MHFNRWGGTPVGRGGYNVWASPGSVAVLPTVVAPAIKLWGGRTRDVATTCAYFTCAGVHRGGVVGRGRLEGGGWGVGSGATLGHAFAMCPSSPHLWHTTPWPLWESCAVC